MGPKLDPVQTWVIKERVGQGFESTEDGPPIGQTAAGPDDAVMSPSEASPQTGNTPPRREPDPRRHWAAVIDWVYGITLALHHSHRTPSSI